MISRQNISIYASRLVVSLMLMISWQGLQAQEKVVVLEQDTIPLLRGFQVSFDIFGAAQKALSSYGQYEGALRVNLRDKWFPIVEIGYGIADTHDEVTEISYKTQAPYFRAGIDFNVLKNKHADNRVFVGARYAFTSYKIDVERRDLPDPIWNWDSGFSVTGAACNYHWMELVFGIDAKVFGPLHLGWSVRYKRRLFHNEDEIGRSWYVPGFGIYNDSRLGGTFNVIIDI